MRRSRITRWLTRLRRSLGPPPPPARRYFSSRYWTAAHGLAFPARLRNGPAAAARGAGLPDVAAVRRRRTA